MASEIEILSINLENAPFEIFDLSTMSVEDKVALKKKLKIELGHLRSAAEKIAAISRRRPCEIESGPTISGKAKRKSMDELPKNVINHPERDTIISKKAKVECTGSVAGKCGSPKKLESEKGKRQGMDTFVIRQCASVLKLLMTHPAGWVFNQPVDPVKLNIPDYFSIISKPMDLGTIKSKLEKKMYKGSNEFSEDVKLTFSNAMLYNPPANNVHQMAKVLNKIFNLRWKAMEEKWGRGSTKVGQQPISLQRRSDMRQACNNKPTSHANIVPKKLMASADKQKLREDLLEISKGKLPPHLLVFLRKFGLIGPNEKIIEVDIDAFDERKCRELQRIIKCHLTANSAQVSKPTETTNRRGRDSSQDILKGTGNNNKGNNNKKMHEPSIIKRLMRSRSICASCDSMSCKCSRQKDFTQVSSSDIDSDKSLDRHNHNLCDGASNLNRLANNTKIARLSKSDPDSDGAVSVVDQENALPTSLLASPAAARGEGWEYKPLDGNLSPSKAIRAATLKSRFADTILKAQHRTLLNNGMKSDPVKMKHEKDMLERKQRKEKARIEAQIRAAKFASKNILKLQREGEREAARIALEKMQTTVEFNDGKQIQKDLEMLGVYCCQQIQKVNRMKGGEVLKGGRGDDLEGNFVEKKPLEILGLFLKEDYMGEEEWEAALNVEIEEGEIGCS